MSNKLQISIPTPCHENWHNMTVADKGRFCAWCQKSVIDFTQSSDRLIAETFKKEGDVCGRFLRSQLEREFVVPKEKNTLWMAASAAVVAFLGLGNGKVFAQTVKTETVQIEKDKATNSTDSIGGKRVITGTVVDETGIEIPGVNVKNLNSKEVIQTDFDGNFSIEVRINDAIELLFIGFENANLYVDDRNYYPVMMKKSSLDEVIYVGGANYMEAYPKRLTFFGRVFNSIGSIFR